MKQNAIVVLDLGSRFVKGAMVNLAATDSQIQSCSRVQSNGIERGEIISIEALEKSISDLFEELFQDCNAKPSRALVHVSPASLKSFNSHGVIRVLRKDVSSYDIKRVLEVACAVPMQKDEQIIHAIEQNYALDYKPTQSRPIGMDGTRLEVNAHIVIAKKTALNLVKSLLKKYGITDVEISFSAGAVAQLLTDDDKELGSVMLDIGHGVTNLIVVSQRMIYFSAVCPLGVSDVISAIADAFNLPEQTATKIFEQYASLSSKPGEAGVLEIQSDRGVYQIDHAQLNRTIGEVYESLLQWVVDCLASLPQSTKLTGGLHLTGGGSLVKGLGEFIQTKTNLDCNKTSYEKSLDFKTASPAEFSVLSGAVSQILKDERQPILASRSFIAKLKTLWYEHF